MYYELTKREKKMARACIDKAFAAEIHEGPGKFEAILHDWRESCSEGDRATYASLYKTMKEHEKSIYRKYDVTGSHYLMLVASVYREGYIGDEDINDFSEIPKKWIIAFRKEG